MLSRQHCLHGDIRALVISDEVALKNAHGFDTNPTHGTWVVLCSAVKRSIGFTIGFHNHGEGPYSTPDFCVGDPISRLHTMGSTPV